MGIIFIIVLLFNALLIWTSPNKKHLYKVYLTNVLIMITYNLFLWMYILNYLGQGGESLGPGLMLLIFTGLHIVALTLYALIRYHVKQDDVPERDHIEILDEILEILKYNGKLAEYERLKSDLAACFIGGEYAALGASTLLFYTERDPHLNDLIENQLNELLIYCHYNHIFPVARDDMGGTIS